MLYRLIGLIMGLWLTVSPSIGLAEMTLVEQQLIERLDAHMNAQRTVRARFVQLNPDGRFVEGTLSLRRPDQARFEYDPPAPLLLIASGNFIIEVDRELEQVTYLPQIDSMATHLLGNNVLQNPDLAVTEITQQDGVISVRVQEADSPENGAITLEFDSLTLNLHRWTIDQNDGSQVKLTLIGPEYNLQLDDDLFHFHAPQNWSVER